MACKALAGLARSERVRQIVGKLPLFASGQIQTLMRDPILQEKRAEHVLFQKYALELLERISGKIKPMVSNQLDTSLANIHKANVVAQTKIQYNEQQLYQLIFDHLESKGLTETAQCLQKEAGLQPVQQSVKNFHQSPFDYKTMPSSSTSLGRNRLRARMQDVNAALNNLSNSDPNTTLNSSFTEDNALTPIKLVKKLEKNKESPLLNSPSMTAACSSASSAQQRSMQKQINTITDASLTDAEESACQSAGVSLSTIVTEYLTNQHALCNNPMTTCPQFDLFTPHKCPDPKPNRLLQSANSNLVSRLFRAQAGYNTTRMDRRFVHSIFAPYRTIRSNDYNEIQFTCCDLVSSTNILIVGTEQGEAKAFNVNDGSELYSSVCHNFLINSIKSNRSADLVLTSCSMSVLWSIRNNEFASQLRFADDFYCEFSKQTQDKVVGTQTEVRFLMIKLNFDFIFISFYFLVLCGI